MKYKDLFIDFDDTLYDTHGNAQIALRETFDEFQLQRFFDSEQTFYDAYWLANIDLWTQYSKGEITRDYLIIERFRRPLSLANIQYSLYNLQSLEELCLKMNDTFLQFCSSKPGVVPGAHELMDYLSSKGYQMHMCSNGFHEVQYSKLEACGLRKYFKTIILSEDAGANKPSPAFFYYAMQHSGAKPDTTIMIGDNLQTDIIGAINVGLPTIFFNRYPKYEKSQVATYTVTSLQEIMTIL